MDKFNDIWKNRFNEGDISIGDWNTPDDNVWTNISGQIPGKRKQKRIAWLLFGLLTLITLVLAYIFLSGQASDSTSATRKSEDVKLITNYISPIDNPKETNQILLTDKKDPDQVRVMQSGNQIVSGKKAKNITDKALHKDSKIVSVFEHRSPDIIDNESGKAGLSATEVESLTVSQMAKEDHLQESETNNDRSRSVNGLPSLSMIDQRVTFDDKLEPALILNDPIEINKVSRLNVMLEAGAVQWNHRISKAYESDLAPFEFNYSDNVGWFTGININYSINQYLDVFGAIRYEQINTTSGHNSELEYNLNEETTFSNDYQLDLATPYGLSKASFSFDRSELLTDDQIDLLVDFKSAHTIRNLQAPIGVQVFPIGKNQRFIPSVAIGVGANYLIGIENEIQSIDTHHDAIKYSKEASSTYDAPTLDQWFFDLNVGVGMGYQITNDLRVGLKAEWSRGLNPIFELENYNTQIDRYRLSLGLSKSF